jgi:hypothetical protein
MSIHLCVRTIYVSALHIRLRPPETDMQNTTILHKYVARAYCSANFTYAEKFVSITY